MTINAINKAFVAAVGVFDGLHLGHRYIIGQAIAHARKLDVASVAVTFERDPDEMFLSPQDQRKLAGNQDRIHMLRKSGVDEVLVLPFTNELASLEPSDFLNRVLLGYGCPKSIHIGADFRFGRKASGTVANLQSWGQDIACEIFAHQLLQLDGCAVTATRIRQALFDGKLQKANRLLGRPHFVRSVVGVGRGDGHKLGFPTANIALGEQFVRPCDGVYFGAVHLDDKLYKAAINVGASRTFASSEPMIEAHLIDFCGNLYGREIPVYFCEYLREPKAFASPEELSVVIAKDVAMVKKMELPRTLCNFIKDF